MKWETGFGQDVSSDAIYKYHDMQLVVGSLSGRAVWRAMPKRGQGGGRDRSGEDPNIGEWRGSGRVGKIDICTSTRTGPQGLLIRIEVGVYPDLSYIDGLRT